MGTSANSTIVRKKKSAAIQPTRRDIKFNLPADRISDWNKNSAHLSHFMNTMSIVFPVGERFFIQSVRNYRDQITDPELQQAVTGFIGQEAMHGREHEEYNEALFARAPSAKKFEDHIARLLGWVQKNTPKSGQLSATIALEHFTAIMADTLLKHPEMLQDADPRYAALWRWHALEETEHKSVAFDVWESVMGRGPRAYVERTGGLVLATVIFWYKIFPTYVRILRDEGKLTDIKGWRTWFHYSLGEVGFLRKLAGPWADYFRPTFHPWDHDNRHFLKGMDAFVAKYSLEADAA
jgi:predicted metal-dependent hydrolase